MQKLLNLSKPNLQIHHINELKERNHMVISIINIKEPFEEKSSIISHRVKDRGTYLNVIKARLTTCLWVFLCDKAPEPKRLQEEGLLQLSTFDHTPLPSEFRTGT